MKVILCSLPCTLASTAWSSDPVMPGPVTSLQAALDLEKYYVEKEGQVLQRAFPEGSNLLEKLQQSEDKKLFMDQLTPVERFRLSEQIEEVESMEPVLFGPDKVSQRMIEAIDRTEENPNPLFVKMLTFWVKNVMDIQRKEAPLGNEPTVRETVKETVRETVRESVKETVREQRGFDFGSAYQPNPNDILLD